MALTIWSFMSSDAECAEVLRGVRWAAGLQCLYCGSSRVVRRGWRKRLYQRYRCKDCRRWFNDKSGTVLAHSKLPLRIWLFTAFMMQSKVSVRELAETLQRPYATVFSDRSIEVKVPAVVPLRDLFESNPLRNKDWRRLSSHMVCRYK
jgi:transposase-like protein